MNDTTKTESSSLKAGLRKRPAMFFGTTGPAAIPRMVYYLLEAIMETSPDTYTGPIRMEITSNTISILFSNLNSPLFLPAELGIWFTEDHLNPNQWKAFMSAQASDRFTLESSNGSDLARYEFNDDAPISRTISPSTSAPYLNFTFHPYAPLFGSATDDVLYNLAGNLRTLSYLRPGLATSLRADLLPSELHYYYKDGLRSLLFEEDYYSSPSRPGCLTFTASENGITVEGHVRFITHGPHHVRSYVNFQPCQGGTHLEGFGKALSELYPATPNDSDDPADSESDPAMILFTNPYSEAKIIFPHTIIAAIHLRHPNPQYFGATKAILANPEALDLVYRAAAPPLKQLWQSADR